MHNSFRKDIMARATQDTQFDDFVRDNLEHEDRNRRHLLVAGKVLMYLRREGKNQVWLAEKMGVTKQYVGKILKGKGNMTMDSIEKLEKATGLVLLVVPTEEPVPVSNRKTVGQGIISLINTYIPVNQIGRAQVPSC